ncbi:MAG: acyl-CoA dehydrogenase family protein [Thermodesulfobacteriota bacterium]
MNYDFTEQEVTFFAGLTEKISPLAAGRALDQSAAAASADGLREVLARLAQTPYLRLGIEPVEGLNGELSLMGAMEVLASISPSAYLSVEASTRLFGRAVNAWGSPEQKARFLEPLLEGAAIGALGLSEATLNIKNEPLKTRGEKQGDAFVVSGAKQYVINAPLADWIAVAGTCEGAPALFLVEKETPGLSVDPPLATLGYEGAAIAGAALENCRIPQSQAIFAEERTSMPKILRQWEDQVLLGASLGLSKTAFESARDYAKSHKSGGKPIIAYQEVGFKLAEMLTLFQTAQLLAYRTAWNLDTAAAEADELVDCAKVFCTEAAEQIASEALKILGGAGFTAGNPVEQAYRCAKYGQIAGTSTEIARVNIGDAALGYRN